MKIERHTIALIVLAMLAGAGCGGGKSSQFYRLSQSEPASHPEAILGPHAVVVVNVYVADYLKRAQMLTAVDAYEYHVEEYHRWAEPIDRSIEAVLRENLSSRLNTPAVVLAPYVRPSAADYRVSVRIDRLDTDSDGRCVLDATWTFGRGTVEVHELARGTESRRFERTLGDDPKKEDYSARVAMMSALLGELSDAVVETARVYARSH